MPFTKKNDLVIAFLVSVLLSLFVNFSMLMRIYDQATGKGGYFAPPPHATDYLYFSLGWFFLFAFLIFITNIQLYKLGDKLFKRKEYKVILFVIGSSLLIAFFILQLYPLIQHFIFDEILQADWPREFGGGRDPFPIPDAPMPFFRNMEPHPFPRPFVTEHLFVFLTIVLVVLLIRLLNSRQQMALEMAKLKTEKLQTSYNALMGQINPHFFFNSLNGLNALIRSGEKENTLTYLDELSNVFRYILQSNRKELVTLAEELQFVKAYTYLLEVRYEGKLFFTIQADPPQLLLYLPILSVLPLIENAVKHNVISKQYPLQIDVYTNSENMLVISNKIQPKAEDSSGSGIGLKNLWGRYKMLTGKDLHISNHKEYFKVSLPLLNTPLSK